MPLQSLFNRIVSRVKASESRVCSSVQWQTGVGHSDLAIRFPLQNQVLHSLPESKPLSKDVFFCRLYLKST
ncbi:Hypothetical predicted protein [Podarcis lilfordi]|uniref:Uncharacterized protein n=1 Tax=Podarcis lilfordi TaxID=74358 RepID=A0AA35NYB7_9SAUR|nr:Hypothetical predicted protein [Podarcis lilfordi]